MPNLNRTAVDLIRASINLRDKFFQRGWITGSKPGDDGLIGMTASGFLAETAALEPIRRADAPLFLVLLLDADGPQLRELRIDIELVALLFGRLVFRPLPGGFGGRQQRGAAVGGVGRLLLGGALHLEVELDLRAQAERHR